MKNNLSTAYPVGRRRLLATTGAAALSAALPLNALAAGGERITKTIPRTGERIPAIGMGTWIEFNVGDSTALRQDRLDVLATFLRHGGGLVDSSPMYGTAEAVIGWCRARLPDTSGLLSATKIWTPVGGETLSEFEQSRALWGVDTFDLMQIHNLVDWEEHLPVLQQAKADGRVRYIGVTTSHGGRHREMEEIMSTQDIDFVQLTYNILDRQAESRLLPLAMERGIGVIANRPFRRKDLFNRYQDEKLPDWISEFDATNWAQFFLKFIISHPAVTCAIPATSVTAHMDENMGAAFGRLPDEDMRRRMADYVQSL
ncbi:MAG: aldo/keto reductase [Alphaproteobacteria bacterium]